MAATSKPVTGAFIIREDKVSDFFAKKAHTSSEVIRRWENRKTKADKVTSTNKV